MELNSKEKEESGDFSNNKAAEQQFVVYHSNFSFIHFYELWSIVKLL